MSKFTGKKKTLVLAAALALSPLAATASPNETNQSEEAINSVTTINVIGSNLALTKGSDFNVPAMEDKINLLNNGADSLNVSLRDISKNFSALQVSGGPRRAAQSFTMRGFDKNGVAVLIDDVPVSFLSQHLNFLPVSLMPVASVEVIRGPFSSIYGSNALGGVVSFKTVTPDEMLKQGQNYGAAISSSYSSANNEINIMGTTYSRNEASDFLGSISYIHSGDTRSGDNNKLKIPGHDQEAAGMLKSNLSLSDKQKVGIAYYFDLNDTTVPVNPEQNNDTASNSRNFNIDHDIKIQSHLVRLSHDLEGNKGFVPNLSTVVYFNYVQQKENPKEDFPGGAFYKKGEDLGKTNYTTGGTHKQNMDFDFNNGLGTSLVYGVDYKYQKQDRNSDDPRGLIANANANNAGLFAQDEIFLTKYVTVLGALRYDYFNIKHDGSYTPPPGTTAEPASSKTYNQFSPKASVTFKPFDPVMVYASYGRAFRTPNLNEMYASGLHYAVPAGPFGVRTNYLIPNPDLKPATSDTVEAGYGFNFKDLPLNGKVSFKNAFYYTWVDNYITLNIVEDRVGGTSQYVNVNKVKMRGVDISTNYENDYFRTALSYNYIEAVDADANTSLMNISANTANFTFEQKVPNTPLFAGYHLRAQSSFKVCKTESAMGNYVCSMGQTTMPGFTTHDIYAGFAKGNYRFSVGIDNIADKFYYDTFSGLPSAGRSYKVLFTMKL